MLSSGERSSLVHLILQRKVVVELLQVVIARGAASKNSVLHGAVGSSEAYREKEDQCTQLCNCIALDASKSPHAKISILSAEVERVRGPNGISLLDFMALSPLFLLAFSLNKLLYSFHSPECRMASIELALAYASQGAYEGASRLLRSTRRSPVLEPATAAVVEELEAFLRMSRGKMTCTLSDAKFQHLLPLVVVLGEGKGSNAVIGVKDRLQECRQMGLPDTDMLYCYLSALTAGFSMLAKYSDDTKLEEARRDILMRSRHAKTLEDLQMLKELAQQQIQEKCTLNAKRVEAVRFIQSIMRRCEGFLRGASCQDLGAVFAFAVVKLRWEKECEIVTDRGFAERLVAFSQTQELDPALRVILLADSTAVLEGTKEQPASYVYDLSWVELPSEGEGLTSQALFGD